MPTLDDGRNAIEQGNLQQARLIFEAILQETPRSEEAWLGLAEVLSDSEDKRICYENALKINKDSQAAKEGLRNLEPKSNPLIDALGQSSRDDTIADGDEFIEEDIELASEGTVEVRDGPPTVALIAIGLLLSVVIFAVGSGAVFFLITSMAGG